MRLQVILADAEMEEIREMATRECMTVSEWVRQVLRKARSEAPRSDADPKIAAVRSAARHSFPTADIGRMLAEIETGRAGPPRT